MTLRKSILVFSLLVSLSVKTQADASDALAGALTAAGVGVATVASSHAYGWARCYLLNKELYGNNKNKHTWNLIDEIFPSVFEMTQASQEVPQKLRDEIRIFDPSYQVDSLYLVNFIHRAQQDFIRLEEMESELVGSGMVSAFLKKIRNNSFYYGIRESVADCALEIVRYKKRLRHIIRVITSMSEFAAQLAHTQNTAKLNYTASF